MKLVSAHQLARLEPRAYAGSHCALRGHTRRRRRQRSRSDYKIGVISADAGEWTVRMPGMGELLIILVIVLLVFGANKLPQLGDGIGKAIKNFKRGLNVDEDIDVTPSDKRVAADSSVKPLDADKVRDAEVIERKS